MPLPNPPRTIYQRNPLEEVICQLRFPTILRIDTEAATFQERIRAEYPLYEEQSVLGQLPPQLLHLVNLVPGSQGQVQRQFSSDDRVWTVALTRDFIALTSKTYERWETYRQHLVTPLAALEQVYAPAFYSRIGLRYRNVIRRSRYNLQNVAWAELLEPHIAAEFSSPAISDSVRQAAHQVTFGLGQFGASIQLQHGLIQTDNIEQCYTIDADFFTDERTERNNAVDVLDYFNDQARRLFHWCISQRLHEALEPVAVPA